MFCSFSHFSTSVGPQQNKTNLNACLNNFPLLVADMWTRGCLGWEKATAKALLDLQTFVTNGVSSLTLSCLTKSNLHSEQHPSVLVENNDRLPFCCTQSIWIPSLLPFFLFMVNSPNNSWAMEILVNQFFVRSHSDVPYPTICEFIYHGNFPISNTISIDFFLKDLTTISFMKCLMEKMTHFSTLH